MREFLQLPASERSQRGLEHTPREICQQPALWGRVVDLLEQRRDELVDFLERSGLRGRRKVTAVLTGAGSSAWAGEAAAPELRSRLRREVLVVPTTNLVTRAEDWLAPEQDYVLVSFARSGDSPESMAAVREVRRLRPEAPHLVIACNRDGGLVRWAESDPLALTFVLPEESNDRSLVMTSSYSSMVLAALGLGWLDDLGGFRAICDGLRRAAGRVLDQEAGLLQEFSRIPFTKICCLGTGGLLGAMGEASLKMQEMTEGRIVAQHASYLGLRHGPQVFVDDRCAVLASLSGDPSVRRYELDLLLELRRKNQGCGTLLICEDGREAAPDLGWVLDFGLGVGTVPDGFRPVVDVVVGQVLGLFKSLEFGLQPDNPSRTGVINRVVTGVVIYD